MNDLLRQICQHYTNGAEKIALALIFTCFQLQTFFFKYGVFDSTTADK